MLRTADKRLRVGERLPEIFGGRALLRYPQSKHPRLSGPTAPPGAPQAWYDFSDPSSLTLAGQIVTAAADKTGNGFTLAATANRNFLTVPLGANGRTALGMLGLSNFTCSLSVSDITSSWFTVACIPGLGAGDGRTLFGSSANGGLNQFVTTGGGLETDKAGTAVLGQTTSPVVTIGVPFVAATIVAATTCRQYLNLTGETDAHAQSLTAGRTIQLGSSVGAAFARGWIGELVSYDTTLADADAEAVIRYLMAKWGVT